MNTTRETSDWRLLVARAWAGRCPRCGDGELFASMFRLHERCSACDMVYRREPGAMTGQMTLTAVATEILAAIMILMVFFLTDWGAPLAISVTVPLVLIFGYWFLPRSMALWVVIEYLTDRGNQEPWTRES